MSKAIDKAAGAKREVVGLRTYGDGQTYGGGAASGRSGGGIMGEPVPRGPNLLTAPATPDAERWRGWGTALKPAHEPIVLARRPLTGTVAGNVLAFGTGGLNVDGCRIDSEASLVRPAIQRFDNTAYGDGLGAGAQDEPAGRWPANVVLDPEAAAMLDEMTPDLKRQGNLTHGAPDRAGATSQVPNASALPVNGYDDQGGASRFFYCAKADAAERNTGLHGQRNSHPTVKPVALMRWLCRLVTPPRGTVLDPFTGSGTTGIAALREGFTFIGIEREAEYVAIARARIIGDAPLLNQAAEVAA